MKTKQTAVEFLIEMFNLKSDLAIIDQAKEMEKQQIYGAFNNGYNNGGLDINKNAEQYYNETFKNK